VEHEKGSLLSSIMAKEMAFWTGKNRQKTQAKKHLTRVEEGVSYRWSGWQPDAPVTR
jgi:hypothetical protein